MRKLAVLLIVLGLGGLVLGSVTIIRNATGPRAAPFSHENYGGPGPIVGALVLLFGGAYLFASTRREG